ncbi:DUF3243 domain-containing protein [Pueribacillus theae]|uniref:DUF3243 domain-containing protein n=1 Tax=Pueribacillus theae TaxID=2171751 RepID=A0A2U1K6E6_9BACI|nr:DUF3243 domain-containing protein [Pueribacillus theae]PWA13100.1 DUF3243 domain-containing protein [Pueribacillus theae]
MDRENFLNKDESIETEKIEKSMAEMSQEEKGSILENFNRFKDFLSGKVEIAEKMGMDEHQLAAAAEKVANFLARNEEPQNREQHLLKEMWMVADEDERHKIAHVLVRMVSDGSRPAH